MTGVRPEAGLVISYAYLWHSDYVLGHEEGHKYRPCVIVSAANQPDAGPRVVVLPITHAAVPPSESAQEIPTAIRRHLRLDDQRSWIVLTEWNEFQWPGPDLGHSGPGDGLIYERLPPRFFEKVRQRFVATVRVGAARPVRRTDV